MSRLPVSRNAATSNTRPSCSGLAAWRPVLNRELADLWISGKAFSLLVAYSILMGIMTYIYSFNTEISLIPPREAIYEILKNIMAVSLFLGLVIGADSLSGERDRATLELLLLAPVNRRHIIVAKLLAGISTWPVAFLIVIPYLVLLAQGNAILLSALFWGAITGTILVMGYTSMGMLISFWSSSNRVSYFVSLGMYALLLIPSELPGDTVDAAGNILQWSNPVAAVNHFLSEYLVNQRHLAECWTWLISSVVLVILSFILLLRFAGSHLRLDAGAYSRLWMSIRRTAGLPVIASLLFIPFLATPVHPSQGQPNEVIVISIDSDYELVKIGDELNIKTHITNKDSKASPTLIVAMNVINLETQGGVVDPEDWSPERTQYIDVLPAGQSVDLDWIIHPIMEGNFMVYMTVIPLPSSMKSTSHPVASSGIHLTVAPFRPLKPAGVIPLAIGEPLFLLAITFFVYWHRRKQIDISSPV